MRALLWLLAALVLVGIVGDACAPKGGRVTPLKPGAWRVAW